MDDILQTMHEIRERQRAIRDRSRRDEYVAALVAGRAAGWALDELAMVTGMSRERIRQIIKKATDA